MLEKQQKLFVQGYNLEVHNVIKYTQSVTGAYVIIMLAYRTTRLRGKAAVW